MRNFWLNLIIALYPLDWRDRYEEEFRAMLEQCNLSLADYLDLNITALETRTGYTWRIIMKDALNRLTGLIALVSALGFASALIIPEEGTAEFMLVVSPILSVLLIPAMHRILKIHKPKLSRMVMATGAIAIGIFVYNIIFGIIFGASLVLSLISLLVLILIGIWLISVNLLAMNTGTLPPLLAIIGVAAGIGWIIVMTTTVLSPYSGYDMLAVPVLNDIYMIALSTLLIGYFLWAIGTGMYFISGRVSRKLLTARVA